MKTVAIYAPPDAVGMSIMLIAELCWFAALRATEAETVHAPLGCVRMISPAGKDLKVYGGQSLPVDSDLQHLHEADAVFLAGFWGSADKALTACRNAVPHLLELHDAGRPIAAVATGTFLLAGTGLLDGKVATTYPPYAGVFRKHFPDVILHPQRAVTDAGGLYCANGIPAGCDLAISIIELLHGSAVARQTAQAFLFGFSRDYVLSNMAFDGQKYHGDRQILTAQQWLERNYAGPVRLASLAAMTGMSPRNFSRRFNSATNESPNDYLRRVRIEAAKDLLREGTLSLAEISERVGYRDTGSFLKAFQRLTGLTPGEFRGAPFRQNSSQPPDPSE